MVPNSLSATFHSAGTFYWAAFYSGDSSNKAAVSGCGTEALVVNQEVTTITVTSSQNPAVFGQQVTFKASVSPVPDGGTVAFADNGTTVGGCGGVAVNTTTGAASCQVSYSAVGAHTIQAAYSGDTSFGGSQSAALTESAGRSLALTGRPSGLTGQARLTLTCAPDSGGCPANVKLTALDRVRHHNRTTSVSITAGKANTNVPAGQFSTIYVGLKRSAGILLKRLRRLPATITVTENGATVARTAVVLTPLTVNTPGAWHVAGAARAARAFPIPKCRWTPASLIGRAFGVPVSLKPPAWTTSLGVTLSCPYAEVRPAFQAAGAELVVIEFHESQWFSVGSGWRLVNGLGSCIARTSCPQPHEPAWVQTTWTYTPGPDSFAYVSGMILRVEDGVNGIQITVSDPRAPLPTDAVARALVLARELLPRFHWS
jgi:hypothetical protein